MLGWLPQLAVSGVFLAMDFGVVTAMNWCAFFHHRPVRLLDDPIGGGPRFWDVVTGKAVWKAKCRCGVEWLTDGGRWFGFRMPVAR